MRIHAFFYSEHAWDRHVNPLYDVEIENSITRLSQDDQAYLNTTLSVLYEALVVRSRAESLQMPPKGL